MRRRRSGIASGAVALALVLAPAVAARDYVPPSKPTTGTGRPKGPFRTLRACRHDPSCFPRIQDAVNEAQPGDTVLVAPGTWREAVRIVGPTKRFIRLIGDQRHPGRVVLDGRGQRDNAVYVGRADGVTVAGFSARHYRETGFFVSGVRGYRLAHLHTLMAGEYGLYAAASVGGTMSDSVAAFSSEAGIAVSQTPSQPAPTGTVVTRVSSYGSPAGLSGVSASHVTVSDSAFYNNGAGIVMASGGPAGAPSEDDVITGNEVFWNDFAPALGAPYRFTAPEPGEAPAPPGAGILLVGGRRIAVAANRVYGNWLLGIGVLGDPGGHQVIGNVLGLGGTDPNGRDLVYDGSGTDTCFAANVGVVTTFPVNGGTLAPCPFSGTNAFDADAQTQALGWLTDPLGHWIRGEHPPRPGVTPLERYVGGVR